MLGLTAFNPIALGIVAGGALGLGLGGGIMIYNYIEINDIKTALKVLSIYIKIYYIIFINLSKRTLKRLR